MRIVVAFLLVILTGAGLAQESVDLSGLSTPPSPAFSLMGHEPVSIARPTTPRALATSLVSAGSLTGLKPNVAVEFAPYWLVPHPNLQFEQYFHLDERGKKAGNRLYDDWRYTSTLSIATRQPDENNPATELGFGYRTQLVAGKPDQNAANIKQILVAQSRLPQFANAVEAALDVASNEIAHPDSLRAFIKAQPSLQQLYAEDFNCLTNLVCTNVNFEGCGTTSQTIDSLRAYISHYTRNNKLLNAAIDSLRNFDQYKRGTIVELAGAGLVRFPTNRWENSRFAKAGGWLTVTRRPFKHRSIEASAAGRYIAAFGDTTMHSIDAGARTTWTQQSLFVAVEGLYRWQYAATGPALDPTWRLALYAGYDLNETIGVTFTLGRDFDNPALGDDAGNMLAVLGLQLGLQQKTQLKF